VKYVKNQIHRQKNPRNTTNSSYRQGQREHSDTFGRLPGKEKKEQRKHDSLFKELS